MINRIESSVFYNVRHNLACKCINSSEYDIWIFANNNWFSVFNNVWNTVWDNVKNDVYWNNVKNTLEYLRRITK